MSQVTSALPVPTSGQSAAGQSAAGPSGPVRTGPVLTGPVWKPAAGVAVGRRPVWLVMRSLFLLCKPRIIELLLVTTLPVMFLAARGCRRGG